MAGVGIFFRRAFVFRAVRTFFFSDRRCAMRQPVPHVRVRGIARWCDGARRAAFRSDPDANSAAAVSHKTSKRSSADRSFRLATERECLSCE